MNVRKLFRLLLAVLVTAGLMVVPLATPAAAEHSMHAAMMQMADMPDQAADMPCCPGKQKGSDCDCPLVAICMSKVFPAGPASVALLMRAPSHDRLRPIDDLIVDGLVRPPPDHPPRSLV